MNAALEFPEGMDWKLVRYYMGRRGLASPDEVVAVILFLASDEARRVHGAIWSVDGGTAAS